MSVSGTRAQEEQKETPAGWRVRPRQGLFDSSRAPVAQLDRALVSEAKGRKFDSCRAHHSFSNHSANHQIVPPSQYVTGRQRPSISAWQTAWQGVRVAGRVADPPPESSWFVEISWRRSGKELSFDSKTGPASSPGGIPSARLGRREHPPRASPISGVRRVWLWLGYAADVATNRIRSGFSLVGSGTNPSDLHT